MRKFIVPALIVLTSLILLSIPGYAGYGEGDSNCRKGEIQELDRGLGKGQIEISVDGREDASSTVLGN